MFTQHPECIIWRMSYYSKAVHFHRYETVKSGTDSECYNPLCFIKHNCHCQKWQNVWVRGDPCECVPRLARVCEGNSLVPSLSPCFCVVRVCWSYIEFCAAVHYSSSVKRNNAALQYQTWRPCHVYVCNVYAYAHICTVQLWACGCFLWILCPFFPVTCSGSAGEPDQAWGNVKDYLLFLQRH